MDYVGGGGEATSVVGCFLMGFVSGFPVVRQCVCVILMQSRHISDFLGHPALIADNSFTTRLPTGVDEAAFGPSSSAVPEPSEDDHAAGYFAVKIRCVLILSKHFWC